MHETLVRGPGGCELFAGALVMALAPAASAGDAQGNQQNGKLQRVGYFPQYGIYARQYFVKNVATSGQAAALTAINYAYGGVSQAGTCTSLDTWADFQRPYPASESVDGMADVPGQALNGNFNQLRKLKLQYPHLRVLLSLGGFTGSTYFSDAALTAASRQQLVASCIDEFIKGNLPSGAGAAAGVFDGFDIDWEWPGTDTGVGNHVRPEDKQNLTLLLAEFRRQLDALGLVTGHHYLLTALLPADPATIGAGIQVPAIFNSLNWATVQGYDLHGALETTTNFQSSLYAPPGDPSTPVELSDNLAIQTYLAQDTPSEKLLLGMPFYGRGWTGVPNVNHGLFQTSTGPAPATFVAGVEDYKVLAAKTGFTLYRDARDGVAWLFDGSTFWTFDDPVALGEKANYVIDQGLGGATGWSLDGDDASASLTKAIDAAFRIGDQ